MNRKIAAMKKNSKKILALILTMILALGMMPAAMADDTDAAESIAEVVETKQAETDPLSQQETSNYIELAGLAAQEPVPMLAAPEEESLGQVRVIVENTTFLEENDESYGAPAWTGTLVDMKVDLNAASTMMSCLVDALDANNYTQYGAENNYVEEINGLSAFDGGFMSGWMGTLNDWFTNEGFGAYTVAAGTLEAGDVVRIMYTCAYGEDIGGSWSNTDTSLKTLELNDGTLSPEFDSDTAEYTLTVPADCESVSVSPEAANKNYAVRVYKNTVDTKAKGYKPDASIAVEDGDTIYIVCGHPDFPSMNQSDGGHTYAVKISKHTHDKVYAEPIPAANDRDGKVRAYKCSICGETIDDGEIVSKDAVFALPENLKTVEEEAFYGLPMQQVTVPAGTELISANAFENCGNLKLVIFMGDTAIADGAFSTDVFFLCSSGSKPAEYADANGIIWFDMD